MEDHFHEVCKPSKVPHLSVKTGVRPCSLWIVVNGVQDLQFHPDSRRFPSGMESRGRNFVRNGVKVMEFRPEWSPQSSGKTSLGLEVLVWGWKSLGMTPRPPSAPKPGLVIYILIYCADASAVLRGKRVSTPAINLLNENPSLVALGKLTQTNPRATRSVGRVGLGFRV